MAGQRSALNHNASPNPTMENPMIQAENGITTSNATVIAHLTPELVEYIGVDEVLITMKNPSGAAVTYTMKTAALVSMINMSVALVNNFSAQVFRDLGVF
jgi:hypothetical protein